VALGTRSEAQPVDAAESARVAEATALLLTLGQALHLASFPADVIEERLAAVARGLDVPIEVFTLRSFLAIGGRANRRPRVAIRRITASHHWNLRRVAGLAALCEGLASRAIPLAEARARLGHLLAARSSYPKPLVTVACGVYSAAIAARVGGAPLEMLAAALAGLVAGAIHVGTLRSRTVDLQKSFLSALCGSVGVFALSLVLPPFDVVSAVFGGITLLVPVMALAYGARQVVRESIESGLARLGSGLLRFLMVAFGVTAAAKLWSLFGALPSRADATPLPAAVILVAVTIGGAALVLCLHGRARDLPWIAGAALFAYAVQETTELFFEGGSPFLSAVAVGIAGQLHGRWPGHFAATIVIPGLLQLVPGFLGTAAIVGLLDPTATDGRGCLDVVLVALQLVIGLALAELVFHRSRPDRTRSRRHR
jgi:uncharacterized membrane protein YjjP (DUF1212 family)